MRKSLRDCRGFTLIELIASITIIAILAAVAVPQMPTVLPYAERGYADSMAAALRQSRAVALASGCEVRFTINAAGFNAFQRAPLITPPVRHCNPAGGWTTPVRGDSGLLQATRPSGVVVAAAGVLVFRDDGTVGGAPLTVAIGPQNISVDDTGLVRVNGYGP